MQFFRGLLIGALVLAMAGGVLAYFTDVAAIDTTFEGSDEAPRIVALSAIAFVILASLIVGPPRLREVLRATAAWGSLAVVLIVGYAYRFELATVGYRVLGALAPGLAVSQADGSVLVVRDPSGHFQIKGDVNGTPVRFLVDTGASAVVLTREDARRSGIDVDSLSFTVPVSTANGRTMVAPTRIDDLRLADIRLGDVRTFVAQEGSLETSLLGMSALSRLSSWTVEGDRLVLNR
ncbi:TIGR02281 family clan AA aspartic protease [Microvirga tunisiensis]|uniref:TIGR02281 family clan AA aspartic protease n=1 Tax=Pannonibacter tanglangensis TaxID=2750084 RepID=A0A7X5J8Q5_9HYPH|nr:TIGR02281 family clan AA aspartic protease [Pannonibacter sp. XCT-53]NBN78117.1 TIGR02281 family clan AA aspartic protease [Pannonibacter sp. XCT-53]